MSNKSITAGYDALPFIARLLIQIFLGWIASGVYRIIRFFETKKVSTLVVGILAVIPPFDFVAWIVDLVTLITSGKITVFVD